MSSEWPQVCLREFAHLLAGFAFKSSGYTEDIQDVRLLRGDNIAPGKIRWEGVKRWRKSQGTELSRYALEPGDVVLAMDRPWIPAGLKVAQINEIDIPCYLVQRVARLRATTSKDKRFLFALLSTPDFKSYIQNATTGTAVPHISAKQILDYEFLLPPAHIRAQVGAISAVLADRITLLRETNATLEAIAQALFKSWFVDFDPVRAKQQGRVPEGMDEATAGLFPDGFEESELGVVPRGWRRGVFSDVCARVESGGTPKRTVPQYWNGGVSWLTSGEVRSPIVFNTKETISDLGVKESSAKLWPRGTTVVAMYGATAGEVCLLAAQTTANQACCGLIPEAHSRAFLFMNTRMERAALASKSSGSAQQNLNKGLIQNHPLILPPAEVLRAYEDIAGRILDSWIANEQQAQTLATLRDTLLPRLISGQLRLPEVEVQVAEGMA